jgi:hypothetical protein
MRRNGNLVDKARAQSFDGPLRSKVVRVAGQGNRAANRADERGKGLTGLKRVLAAAEGFQNLEADVSGANSNMLRIANAKVDVADQHAAGSEDAKVVIRNKAVRRLTGHHTDELKRYVTRRQSLGWNWKRLSCEWRGHGRLTFVQSHGARIAGGLRSDGVRYRGGRRECMDDVCSTSS